MGSGDNFGTSDTGSGDADGDGGDGVVHISFKISYVELLSSPTRI